MPNAEEPDANKQKDGHDFVGFPTESLSHERANNSNAGPSKELSLTLLEVLSFFNCICVRKFLWIVEISFFHMFGLKFWNEKNVWLVFYLGLSVHTTLLILELYETHGIWDLFLVFGSHRLVGFCENWCLNSL